MLFNSYIFIFVFLPVVLAGWWMLRGTSFRLLFITLASYVFYGWWNWRFLPLMIASTTVDYIAGGKIAESEDQAVRKRWLIGSLTFNLAVLGFFKYMGFFADSINRVTDAMGGTTFLPAFHLILPLGISFYTFNSMSYTIDVYRRKVQPAKSILHFSAFVALFPHLVAGPIVRYSDIENQFNALKTRLTSAEASIGIYFFVVGLAKKLLIADHLAGPVGAYFDNDQHHGAIAAWIGLMGYNFQLYFDFSGYSDMAVGLAHMLGIQFPQNFNSPYKATSVADYWHRWHMSLSTWLRDYLYFPLGGSRGTIWRTGLNLAITMFLGGLWHGANWTFVIWGLYHGTLLASYYLLKKRGWTIQSTLLSQVVTFILIAQARVFFRANTLTRAGQVFADMYGASGIGSLALYPLPFLLLLGVAMGICFFCKNSWELQPEPRPIYAYALGVALIVCVLFLGIESPFLYFQF